MNVLVIVLQLVVLLVVVLLHVAYATYFERKVIGHMQMRMGPTRVGWLGLLQPIADGIKSFTEEKAKEFKLIPEDKKEEKKNSKAKGMTV